MPNCLEKKGWVGGSSQYLQPKSPSPEVWWDDLCVWQSWTGVFHLSRYHWCVSPWDFIKTVPKAAFLFLPKWSEFSETDVFSTPQPARGFSPSLLPSSWNFTCRQAWCHSVHVHRQRPQLCSSSPDGVWSNLGRLKAAAGEEWHTFLVLLTAKCAQTLKTGRISLLPETLLCVCAQLPREEENWSLLAGMPGMDAVEMWPEEQPTITHLSFLSLCTCSMFFSILTAFRLLWTQLHPARWPCSQLESCAGRGTGWGADQMLRWSKIKKNPVGLSLIALAGNVVYCSESVKAPRKFIS